MNKPKFKVGEKVKVIDRVGYIKEIVERGSYFKEKFEYFIEFYESGFFGIKTKTSWELESFIGRFINPN